MKVFSQSAFQYLEKWSMIIAAFSQVAMLWLVWYGYEHTVKPVFEMSLLSEKVAELEITKNDLSRRVESLTQLKISEQAQINGLNTELQTTKELVKSTNEKYRYAFKSYRLAEQRLSSIQARIALNAQQLYDAQWKLMLYALSSAILISESQGSSGISSFIDDLDKPDAAELIQKAWPDPHKALTDALNIVENENNKKLKLPQSIINETRTYINDHKMQLVCASMDFNGLIAQYHKDIMAADASAQNQLPAYLDKIIKENSEPNVKVEITQQFRNQSLAMLKAGNEFDVKRKYSDELFDMAMKCEDKLFNLNEQLAKAKGFTDN